MTAACGQKELSLVAYLKAIGNGSEKRALKCVPVILKTANKSASGPLMTEKARHSM